MGHFIGFIFEIVVLACCVGAIVTNSLLLASCEVLDLATAGIIRGSLGLYRGDFPDGTSSTGCIVIDDIPNIDDYKDAAFNCSRVCAVVGIFCGLILTVFGFFKQCLCPLPCSQIIMDLSATGVQIMLALVYVIYLTEACNRYQCYAGQGLTYLYSSQILWLAASCFTRCMRPGRYERRDEIAAEKAKKTEEKEQRAQKEALEEERKKNAELQHENANLRAAEQGGTSAGH